MGARKPQALIELPGTDPIHLPVCVARRLDASDAYDPGSRAELLYNIRELSDECAWAKLVELVSRRDYSRQESVDRLVREGFSRDCSERAVERGVAARIVNDARFADYFVRAKVSAGWGPLRIERELSRRGISVEDVSGWPDEFFGDEGPARRARELLERKPIPRTNAYARLVRFLASRGFSLTVAKDAVRERLSLADEDSGGTS